MTEQAIKMPDMPFNWLPWIVGGGFLLAFIIVAFAVIRMLIAMKRAHVKFKDLGKTLDKIHEMENQEKKKI